MKGIVCFLTLILIKPSAISQEMTVEDYYTSAVKNMTDMLAGRNAHPSNGLSL